MIKNIFLILAALVITGCSCEGKEQEKQKEQPVRHVHNYNILIDTQTGCEYLVYEGVYPRLNSQGKQICNKGENK